MTVADSPVLPGGLHITCPHPRCRFSGSVVNLVERARNVPPPEAMSLFLAGGPLHGLFFAFATSGLPESDFIKYELSRSESQKKVLNYFIDSHQLFMDDTGARNFVFLKGVKEDHFQQFQCGVPSVQVPDELCTVVPQKDRQDLIMFPYSVTGTITQLAFHSMTTGNRSVAQVDPSVQGVFCPRPLHEMDAHTLIICFDEFDAMTLHCKLKEIALAGYAAISALGTPSLECIPPDAKILLLSHSDSRLHPEAAIAIRRARPAADIRVLGLGVPLLQLASMKLRQVFDGSVDTWRWIVDSLAATYANDGLDRLSCILASMGLSPLDKINLLDTAAEAGIQEGLFMEEIRLARPVCMIRKYGNMSIKRTFSGYEQTEPLARKLSNFILIVNCISGDSDKKIVCATVKTPAPSCPGYEINIPVESLMTPNGSRMATLIWDRLVEQGSTFNPFAENLVSVNWFDLIRQFDGAIFKDSSRLIGVSEGMIRFPGRRISTTNMTDTVSDCPPGLSEGTLDLYRKVGGNQHSRADIKSLLKSDSPVILVLGLLAGSLYECVRHSMDTQGYTPRHIIVPCTARGSSGELAVRQLNWIFAGDEEPESVPAAGNALRAFTKLRKETNGLPLVCQAHEPLRTLGSGCLKYVKGPVVLVHPVANMQYLNRIQAAYFINDGDMPGSREVCQDTLLSLRAMIGDLILTMAGELKKGAKNLPAHPACAALTLLAAAAEVDVPGMSAFTDGYSQIRGKSAEYFLELLGRAISGDIVTIALNKDAYQLAGRMDTDMGYWHGHRVVRVSPAKAVDTVNAMLPVFSRKELTLEFIAKGIMDSTYSRRVGDWVFSGEMWEKHTGNRYNIADAAADLGFMKIG